MVLNVCNKFEVKMQKMAGEILQIEQGYLHKGKSLTVRLRKQTNRKEKTKHILCVKRKIKPGRVIEIETKISKKDYDELSKYAQSWLTKTRYIVDGWDVDFFKNDNLTYFVMAEIEMLDDQNEPPKVPKFIVDNLVYSVSREDGRFSSKKLSDITYAKTILKEISKDIA